MFSIRQKLIWLPGLFLLAGNIVLDLKKYPQVDYTVYVWLLVIGLGSVLVDAILRRAVPAADEYLFPLAILLADMGILMIGRLKPALLLPQIRWLLIGLVVFIVVIRLTRNIHQLVNYQYLLGLASLLLLCSTLVFGTDIGGNKNWIVFGPFQVQPSEFAKLLTILFLSAYLTDHKNVLTLPNTKVLWFHMPPLRFIAPLLVIWGMAILMFVLQHDLGSALLFFGLAVFMTYMATGNKSYVFFALLFFSLASVVSYHLFGHVRVRVAIWANPWADPTGQAYQIVQSLFAFGSGGLWGSGFAHGFPGLIPEVHTDFIFSAIAEEFGFMGSFAIILLYVILLYRGFRTALLSSREMNMLIAAGLTVSFSWQVFIILAGITKLLPMTGITLPFISYGGSSMVSSFISLGLLFALSKKENNHA